MQFDVGLLGSMHEGMNECMRVIVMQLQIDHRARQPLTVQIASLCEREFDASEGIAEGI